MTVFTKLIAALLMAGRVGPAASFTAPMPSIVQVRSPTSTAPTSTTATALEALPSWVLYSAGHIVGGASGTPTVVKATKSWYPRLPLPSWTPPNFVFGPVWTLLYGLMGVSVSRIAASGSPMTKLATRVWMLHYGVNLSWAPIFFGFRNLRLGLIVNFFLVASLGYVVKLFHGIDPLAAYLQIPYLLWLLYATKLNETICNLNPMVGGVNKAMLLADAYADGEGDRYDDAMLQYDVKLLQDAAAQYAGL